MEYKKANLIADYYAEDENPRRNDIFQGNENQ